MSQEKLTRADQLRNEAINNADHEAGHLTAYILESLRKKNQRKIKGIFQQTGFISAGAIVTSEDEGISTTVKLAKINLVLVIISFFAINKAAEIKAKIKGKAKNGRAVLENTDTVDSNEEFATYLIHTAGGDVAKQVFGHGENIDHLINHRITPPYDMAKIYQIMMRQYPDRNHKQICALIKIFYEIIADFMGKHKKLISLISNYFLENKNTISEDLTPEILQYLKDHGYTEEDFQSAKRDYSATVEIISNSLD